METILWLFAGHFIGDFSFQSQWMASQKGKSWEVNLYHALVYTATVFIVAALGGFLIDPLKARWNIVKYIWLDQILHLCILLIVALLFV